MRNVVSRSIANRRHPALGGKIAVHAEQIFDRNPSQETAATLKPIPPVPLVPLAKPIKPAKSGIKKR
jgi:hypothetical protein